MTAYEPRTYRKRHRADDLVGFRVAVGETNLDIQALGEPQQADQPVDEWRRASLAWVREARRAIETEIAVRPEFLTSLAPLNARPGAPPVVQAMYEAAARAGVGPMAAVAGAVAEYIGRRLLERPDCRQVIVENGGDIFLCSRGPRSIAVYAGRSVLSGKVALRLPGGTPLGVCTSSGTVGPSYSAGEADAALIVADDTAFADALASALGNRVHGPQDAGPAVEWALTVPGVRQALVIVGDTMAVGGEFEVARIGE